MRGRGDFQRYLNLFENEVIEQVYYQDICEIGVRYE